jgi:hypothetical protein
MKNKTTGVTTVFAKDDDGLIPAPLGPESNTKLVNLLTTAEGKQDNVHEWRAECTDTARTLYQVIGFPSIRDYKHFRFVDVSNEDGAQEEEDQGVDRVTQFGYLLVDMYGTKKVFASQKMTCRRLEMHE